MPQRHILTLFFYYYNLSLIYYVIIQTSSVDILRFIPVEIAYDKELQRVVEASDYSAETNKKRKKGDLVCPGCGVALAFRKGGVYKSRHSQAV